MNISTIKKAMRDHLINSKSEASDAFLFVIDLFYAEIEETKANEPYAVVSIERMESALREVESLDDVVDDILPE